MRITSHANLCHVESLEQRQHLTVVNPMDRPGSPGEHLTKADVERIIAAAASQALPTQVIAVVDREAEILGVWAGKDARVSAPVDQTGQPNILLSNVTKAITRARTGAFFQSRGEGFTTRTARFIIQDQFPFPVPNTPGGPLYGVEFSTLPFSDFSFNSLGTVVGPAVSGDPGGVPLFKNGEPVGGIGVAGDGRDFLVREGLPFDKRVTLDRDSSGTIVRDENGKPKVLMFDGNEEDDFDEAVALAGAGNKFMADFDIQAERIFVAGLRFPFDHDRPASGNASMTLAQLQAAGAGSLINPQQVTGNIMVPNPNTGTNAPLFRDAAKARGSPTPAYPTAFFGGIDGELKNQFTSGDPNNAFGFVPGGADSTPPDASIGFAGDDTNQDGVLDGNDPQLNVTEVKRIITNAVKQTLITRGGIREPLGVPARVHIAVVDRSGTCLGAFRMDDGTNFSYDVAIQKARTANFFSDNDHAFAARSIGFVSQGFFPPGIVKSLGGPLFHLQNALSLGILNVLQGGAAGGFAFPINAAQNPLANGITIFPGGAPLYKDGVLVGGIGVSGDGVDQDDIISFAGTRNFRIDDDDPQAIRKRVDYLSEENTVAHLKAKVSLMFDLYNLITPQAPDITEADVLSRLDRGLDNVRLPYQKFPRNFEV